MIHERCGQIERLWGLLVSPDGSNHSSIYQNIIFFGVRQFCYPHYANSMKIDLKSYWLAILVLGCISLLAYTGLFEVPIFSSNSDQIFRLVFVLCGVWVCYLLALLVLSGEKNIGTISWLLILGFAGLFRLQMVQLPALQSTDYLRYLFDGKLLLEGINPYSAPPLEFPQFGGNLIPKPWVITIYPPLAELLFLLANWLGGSLQAWRGVNLVADLGCILLLSQLLRKNKIPQKWLIAYLWSPLILKESINSAHLDIWTLFLVLLFVFFWQARNNWGAMLSICCAVLIKLVPVIFIIPWFITVPGTKKRLLIISVGVLILLLPFVPFLPHEPLGSLLIFFTHVEGYGLMFNMFQFIFSPETARILLTATGGACLFYLTVFRGNLWSSNPLRIFELGFILYLFSSMGFPWYLTVTVPLTVFFGVPFLTLFVMLSHLTYYLAPLSLYWLIPIMGSGVVLIISILVRKEFYSLKRIYESH